MKKKLHTFIQELNKPASVVSLKSTPLREQYIAKKIFNIGDKVTDGKTVFEIVDRGTNYLSVIHEGVITKKWLDAVKPCIVEDILPISDTGLAEISYKGYVTKNFYLFPDALNAFQLSISRATTDPVALLNALKATDTYLGLSFVDGLTDSEKEEYVVNHEKARVALNRIGEFAHHQDYWHMNKSNLETKLVPFEETGKAEFRESKDENEMKFSPNDKLKVARIIATALGGDNSNIKSNPEGMVNTVLRQVKYKRLTPEAWKIIGNMLDMAEDAGIEYDKTILAHKVPDETPEVSESVEEKEDISDEDIDSMISGMSDDDYMDAYDDEELSVIDDETGEHISDLKEELITEVLSRAERIRASVRFARSQDKRERRTRIALKSRSTSAVINKRARRLAVNLMKKKLARKPLDTLSVGEKERIEGIVQKRKASLDRIAMKLVPRVRKIESDRLTHKTYTK